MLLGESAHFGPARVDSLEAELEGQQKRIRELETRLATAEGDAEELRQALGYIEKIRSSALDNKIIYHKITYSLRPKIKSYLMLINFDTHAQFWGEFRQKIGIFFCKI